MKKLYVFLFGSMITFGGFADDTVAPQPDDGSYQSVDELLYQAPDETPCATAAFADALAANVNTVSETDSEQVVQQWIYDTFAKPDVLNTVLACPEIQSLADDDNIKLQPIKYTFPAGREIVINYSTQPRILKQRIDIANKRDVNALNDPNPKIGAIGDTAIWTNTDPAWYAIMVTEHGALDNFVGPDKNNTISLKYIEDNIDSLYPKNSSCTDKSAFAGDKKPINKATVKTIGVKEATGEDDTNDYYVAGDVSLQWVSYAEIALDVVITVVTFGGGTLISGITKAARASKTLHGLGTTIKTLRKSDKVIDYIKLEQRLYKSEQAIARIKKYQQLEKELSRLDKVRDATKYADKANELGKVSHELRSIDKLTDASKYADDIKRLETETTKISKNMREARKADKEVGLYADARKAYSEIQQYRRAFKNFKAAKTGNVATRTWKAIKAARKGNKALNKGARIARSSMKSGRVRDWLFQSTMRNIGKLGKLEADVGLLYSALKFAGDMYDWTETSTGDYTNGIEFKPLLLLSADDLEGQENEVNYGMWLLWSGDSTSPEDDDAAYLQAMDFAEKFHNDLIETMDDDNNNACNVDIYVVRPVLRNPDVNAELYYLIMNDEPWTTAE